MVTITEFLEARISEDEAAAKAAKPEDWWWDGAYSNMEDPFAAFPVHNNPARVLAECAAKRAIVAMAPDEDGYVQCGDWESCSDSCPGTVADYALRALAAVYASHPDYRPEWAA